MKTTEYTIEKSGDGHKPFRVWWINERGFTVEVFFQTRKEAREFIDEMKSRLPSAQRLKAIRLAKDLSQQDLADLVGLKRQSIAQLEWGRRTNPPVNVAIAIARALGTTVEEIWG